MRMSSLLAPTLREDPAEAEVVSHRLMLRAGFIRKLAAGVYTYLPLGYRVIKKIEKIVREEMDKAGGQELLMPAIHPAELWQETGRWDVYGEEMMRFADRNGRPFCLGPTHEEVITDLVRREISSYRSLPVLLYQIQTKYRDEIRPRFGLMRAREFIMKDAYSFDRDEEGLDESYRSMYQAYNNIFRRCGLDFRPVEADSGAIGGQSSHEFMVLAENGEAEIAFCEACDYAANTELAKAIPQPVKQPEGEDPLVLVPTPGVKTIEDLTGFFKVPPERFIKTLIYRTVYRDREELVAVLLRGDRELNEVKLLNRLHALHVELAGEEQIRQVTHAPVGFAGPVGLTVPVYADWEVKDMKNAIAGANQADSHYTGVNPGRDFSPAEYLDLRLAVEGDQCPKCGHSLHLARGIEVGHIFKLGTKYSEAMSATFSDEKGEEKPVIMGCYGIGIGRTAAAAIEQNYDEAGIIWPMPIAPYHVVVVPVNAREENQMLEAERIYRELWQQGVEAVLDDRDERPGVKFKDADLIGFPLRITVGPKGLAEGKVELKFRRTGEMRLVALADIVDEIKEIVERETIRA